MRRVRSHLTYANVISTLCLFVLLGGGAYAAFHLPRNSVRSKNIVNGQVKTVDLHRSERFHVVGTPGEPFENGASSYGVPPHAPVGFYRDPLGIVRLRGVIDQGTGNNGKVEFTLPLGYRPPADSDSTVLLIGGSSATGRVLITPNGEVTSISEPGGLDVLDGITFRCGPLGKNGCP